ncbi:MAG: AAC(3) family N-acetyltransferase [Ruminococcaceae bacterium]|nr:AAC(3) family N-acetyltransferase [Oscillospiraceae bacterium]
MISKEEIIKQLSVFSFAKGKPVIVHTSLKAIGEIEGGGETLLSALIEFFTDNDGLLCVPTHTWDRTVFDMSDPSTCIGILPTLAASRKDGVRSKHPTHSMAAFGKGAKAFVENEEFVSTPTSPDGAYGNLYKMNGYVLLLGVGHDKNTYLHCVEEMLKVENRLTKDTLEFIVITPDKTVTKRHLFFFREDEIPDVSVYFPKFEPAFRNFSAITDGKIGNAKAQLCSAVKMKEVIEIIYKRNKGKELLADAKPLGPRLYKEETK